MHQPEMQRIAQGCQAVVEGEDDKLFLEALLRHEGIPGMQVIAVGGKTQLPANLKALRAAPQFGSVVRSLGVIRDADADPDAAFRSVCGALYHAGLPTPPAPAELAAGPPRVGVFVLPSGSQRGALEDLCLAAVADDPAYPCVEQYFQCLAHASVECPREWSRARMQVFLASRAEIDRRLGVAAQAGYIPWASPVFDGLKRFLHALAR